MSLNNEVTYSIDTNQVIISTPGPQGPSGNGSGSYSASAGSATYAASAGYAISSPYIKFTPTANPDINNYGNFSMGDVPNLQILIDSSVSNNIAIGGNIQTGSITGTSNIAIGTSIQSWGDSAGNYNISLGSGAGNGLVSGDNNVFIGRTTGAGTNPGYTNIGIGLGAFGDTTLNSEYNIAIGAYAMSNYLGHDSYTGIYNALIGAGTELTSGSISGAVALGSDSSGNGAVAQGNNWIQLGTDQHTVHAQNADFVSASVSGSIIATQAYVQANISQAKKYGSFYDSGSQVAANTGSAYAMRFQYTDYANGVSVSSSSIIFAYSGVYNIQWSGQFENTDTSDHDACVWMKKNGVDVVGSTGVINIPSKHGAILGHTISGWNYIMPMNAGDWIQLYWQVDDTNVTIQYYPGQINPVRPDTSSILLTAVQI